MPVQSLAKESVIYWGLAAVLAATPFILFHHAPIIYAHLIAEDFAGEYATAVAFTAAGLLFLYDGIRAPNRGRKTISLLMALVAILIAGEEVSWGQRQLRYLFGFSVPEPIREANLQGEMNLHNLELVGLSTRIYQLGAYMLLLWLVLSTLIFTLRKEFAARLSTAGVPLVPLRLLPVCILPALFFLLRPVAKSAEVGELLVGVAALSFALDRAWSSGLSAKVWLPSRPVAVVTSLIAVGVLGLGLAAFSPLGRMAWRLETLAARDYASFGMYEQAKTIFDYIYAHPSQLVVSDTRLSHAEMLAEAGELAEARRLLALALSEHDGDMDAMSGDFLRRTGQLYARFGEGTQAEEAFAAALTADERSLETTEEADERARLLLSLARTLSAQGLLDEAASMTRRAQQMAVAASTRDDVRRWKAQLEEKLAAASPSPASGNAGEK